MCPQTSVFIEFSLIIVVNFICRAQTPQVEVLVSRLGGFRRHVRAYDRHEAPRGYGGPPRRDVAEFQPVQVKSSTVSVCAYRTDDVGFMRGITTTHAFGTSCWSPVCQQAYVFIEFSLTSASSSVPGAAPPRCGASASRPL